MYKPAAIADFPLLAFAILRECLHAQDDQLAVAGLALLFEQLVAIEIAGKAALQVVTRVPGIAVGVHRALAIGQRAVPDHLHGPTRVIKSMDFILNDLRAI